MNGATREPGLLQRVMTGISAGIARGLQPLAATAPAGPWSADDLAILRRVEQDLAAGRALRQWWDTVCATEAFEWKFELQRNSNPAERAYGFFDSVPTAAGPLPVIGTVQKMRFDRSKSHPHPERVWLRQQLREFVLHYFMRVSSFTGPNAWARSNMAEHPDRAALSWCPAGEEKYHGFGFSQLYFSRNDGTIGPFADEQKFEMIDLRRLVDTYRWIVAKVQIYDFSFAFQPFDPPAPQFVFGLNEESYLVLSQDFIVDREHPAPGVDAEFGLGYAYLKNVSPGVFAYGPGEFDAAFQLIRFSLLSTGEIEINMVFVANRPKGVLNVQLDPFALGFRTLNALSFGIASKGFAALRNQVAQLTGPFPTVDPVYGYVSAINALTSGRASREWCISRDQLSIDFLVKHFEQHYNALANSLYTWRQIPDWLDSARLPDWVVTGKVSTR